MPAASTRSACSAAKVERRFCPSGHGHATQAASLPEQVDNHPAALAEGDVVDLERRQFGAAQPAADEQSEQGAVADGP
jgi:hypothetical protein